MESEVAHGCELLGLAEELYPICRSITGDGVRASLQVLRKYVPLDVHEVASGTKVFDWTVPDEWNIRDAWIMDDSGRKVVDFQQSNLHVVSYSEPVRRRISNEELQPHLHSLADHPDWIPYRTSYYTRTWGFCVSENQRQSLSKREYEICIDSQLTPGFLTYGELCLPGERPEEFLITTHICHPSLCNDNLSGIAISVFLARHMSQKARRWSYRFLYIPGTIGAVTWLARNRESVDRIRGGLTLACLGDPQGLTYKRSFQGNAEIDRAVALVLRDSGQPHEILDFVPYGYDERQFNSPGFRLPVGSLTRSRHGAFPEYHTSADNLRFVSGDQLHSSLACLTNVVDILETNASYKNRYPFGEPQLGKHHIDRDLEQCGERLQRSLYWVLCLSDGDQSLMAIAERSKLPFRLIQQAAGILHRHGMVEQC